MGDTHAAVLAELAHDAVQRTLAHALLNRHTHMHLTRADKVDHNAKPVQHTKYTSEEPVRDVLAIAVHVYHHNALLDRHGRGSLERLTRC